MSAKHVKRVLSGTPPRDLPIENFDRIELHLNLRTAQEIGIASSRRPSSCRADKVIE